MKSPRVIPSTLALAALVSSWPSLVERPVHTYSIVARDLGMGQLGVALQSQWVQRGSDGPVGRSGDRCRRQAGPLPDDPKMIQIILAAAR